MMMKKVFPFRRVCVCVRALTESVEFEAKGEGGREKTTHVQKVRLVWRIANSQQ